MAADSEAASVAGKQTGGEIGGYLSGEMGGEADGHSGERRRDSQATAGRRDGGKAEQADVRVVAVVGAQHVPGLRALLAKSSVK